MTETAAAFLTPDAALAHWQGHRGLTRRAIEAFPEDQLFTHSAGGMRPFGELAKEMLAMTEPMVRGVVTGEWGSYAVPEAGTKAELLAQWDATTEQLDSLWRQIPAAKFEETMTAFGQYTDKCRNLLMYCIDNEIHHRGQGYVYLRTLGIEPPPFWER
jgi:uncharacterized damage-inducible protein DinB